MGRQSRFAFHFIVSFFLPERSQREAVERGGAKVGHGNLLRGMSHSRRLFNGPVEGAICATLGRKGRIGREDAKVGSRDPPLVGTPPPNTGGALPGWHTNVSGELPGSVMAEWEQFGENGRSASRVNVLLAPILLFASGARHRRHLRCHTRLAELVSERSDIVMQQLFRRFGGVAMRLVALSLMVVASMGLISAGPNRGVSAQEVGLSADPGEGDLLVSELVVAPEAQVIGEAAFVVVEELSYRDGPGLDSAVIDLLPYGTTGVITDGPVAMDGYTWFEFDVDGYGATPGWVAGEFLATEEGSSDGSDGGDGTGIVIGSEVIVAADDLNLRDEPGLAGATLAALPIGMPLTVLDGPVAADGYSWYLVQVPPRWVRAGWLVSSWSPRRVSVRHSVLGRR